MTEREWDRDFDLTAWRKLSAAERQSWIEEAWRRENDQDRLSIAASELPSSRRRRYERGQTAWDIGLDPQPFDITLSTAVGEVKPELANGCLFGFEDVRDRVLSALLANAGIRRTVRLAPVALWREALSSEIEPVPVVRPEFVTCPERFHAATYWLRHRLTQPFYRAYFDTGTHPRSPSLEVLEVGYLRIGNHSLLKPDLIVLRDRWQGPDWPTPADALLVVEISSDEGDVLYDWEIRRPAYLEAGTAELWVIDPLRHRILRQARAEPPTEIIHRPDDPEQTIRFEPNLDRSSNGEYRSVSAGTVSVRLSDLFSGAARPPEKSEPTSVSSFNDWDKQQQLKLQRYETPWTIGYTPQWFDATIVDLTGRFKDELWKGILFGPEYRRDQVLSALLANVGLWNAIKLAPLELWHAAVAELDDHDG